MSLTWLFGAFFLVLLVFLEWILFFEFLWDRVMTRRRSLKTRLLYEWGITLGIGLVAFLITKHLVIALVLASPVWFLYSLFAIYLLAEKVKEKTGVETIKLVLILVSFLAFLVISLIANSPLLKGDFYQTVVNWSGFLWGFAVGGVSVAAGFLVATNIRFELEKTPLLSTLIMGFVGWLICCVLGTWLLGKPFQQAFPPEYLAGNFQGLYVTGLLFMSVAVSAVGILTFFRARDGLPLFLVV